VPFYDDRPDGNLQKFEQDLRKLAKYKKQDPEYLNDLISRM
jgi:hypothetical protein